MPLERVSHEQENGLINLLFTGTKEFIGAFRQRGTVHFSDWAENLRRSCKVSDRQLRWLWDSIVAEPSLKSFHESFVSWKEDAPQVMALPAGSTIGFLRSPYRNMQGKTKLVNYDKDLEFTAILQEPLFMRPGKKYYECCSVPVEVHVLKRDAKGIGSLATVADKLRIHESQVVQQGNHLLIGVPSLNVAMTVARYLLRPDLTATGGNVFHYAFWMGSKQSVYLDYIRSQIEKGDWNCPSMEDVLENGQQLGLKLKLDRKGA